MRFCSSILAIAAWASTAYGEVPWDDVLGGAGGRKLFGQSDFRGVLHRGPRGSGKIPVVWLRDGKVQRGELEVAEGWRKTNSTGA